MIALVPAAEKVSHWSVSVVSLGVVDDRGLVVVLFASHAGQDPQKSMESALSLPAFTHLPSSNHFLHEVGERLDGGHALFFVLSS